VNCSNTCEAGNGLSLTLFQITGANGLLLLTEKIGHQRSTLSFVVSTLVIRRATTSLLQTLSLQSLNRLTVP